MSFSATDAAFEGFRLIRRNPLIVVAWALLYAVLTVAKLLVTGESAANFMAVVEGMDDSVAPTLESLQPMFEAMVELSAQSLWLLPASIAVSAMVAAAAARGVLWPDRKGAGLPRLGMDEARVFVVSLVLGLLSGMIGGAAMAAALAVAGAMHDVIGGWSVLLGVLGVFAVVALMIWLAVRWSLAVPIVVAEKRIVFFRSFTLTRGRFWPLLGMAVIAGLMTLVVMALGQVVAMPLAFMTGAAVMSGGADASALAAAFDVTNPWVLAGAVVNAVISALMAGVMYAPFAAAYAGIAGVPAQE